MQEKEDMSCFHVYRQVFLHIQVFLQGYIHIGIHTYNIYIHTYIQYISILLISRIQTIDQKRAIPAIDWVSALERKSDEKKELWQGTNNV